MSFVAINLLLPAVLAVHQIEEVARFQEFSNSFPPCLPSRFRERSSILAAVILLTLAVSVLAIFTCMLRGSPWLPFSRMAIFALLLNGFSHCVRSVQRRKLLPGTVSAALLILPYGAIAVLLMRSSGLPMASLLRDALAGAAMMPCVAVAFLTMGACSTTLLRLFEAPQPISDRAPE